jgi:hypothetical protein
MSAASAAFDARTVASFSPATSSVGQGAAGSAQRERGGEALDPGTPEGARRCRAELGAEVAQPDAAQRSRDQARVDDRRDRDDSELDETIAPAAPDRQDCCTVDHCAVDAIWMPPEERNHHRTAICPCAKSVGLFLSLIAID